MTLQIKNMVCDRCIMVVKQQLENLGFSVSDIVLGRVVIDTEPDEYQMLQITSALRLIGFDLINNEKQQIIEQIKNIVIDKIHHTDLSGGAANFLQLLPSVINKEYGFLSRLFSQLEGSTIEKFIIRQKIEKAKELLEYGELNLNEISYKLGYSSSAYLSTQFKNITGLTPKQYKLSNNAIRSQLDKI